MSGNIHINNVSYPNITYFIPFFIVGIYVILFIVTLNLFFKHLNKIEEDNRAIFIKKSQQIPILLLIIVQSFYIVLLIIEIISYIASFDLYLALYNETIWAFSIQILIIVTLILMILFAYSFSYYVYLSNLKEKSNQNLVLTLMIIFVILWNAVFLMNAIFADYFPYIVGKLSSSYYETGDSIIRLIISTIAIILLCVISLLVNKRKLINLEYEKISFPLKIYSPFSLLFLSLLRIGWFVWGVLFTKAMPDNYSGNINAILFYGYLIIRTLISINYLIFFIEIFLKFKKIIPEQYLQNSELE